MCLRVFSLCVALAAGLWAGDLNGKWKAKVEGPNGEMEVTYVLKVEEGKISGTVTSHLGEMKVSEGTLTGDDVAFVVNGEIDGQVRKIAHKGKLAGDDLNMTIEMGQQTIEIRAKRS